MERAQLALKETVFSQIVLLLFSTLLPWPQLVYSCQSVEYLLFKFIHTHTNIETRNIIQTARTRAIACLKINWRMFPSRFGSNQKKLDSFIWLNIWFGLSKGSWGFSSEYGLALDVVLWTSYSHLAMVWFGCSCCSMFIFPFRENIGFGSFGEASLLKRNGVGRCIQANQVDRTRNLDLHRIQNKHWRTWAVVMLQRVRLVKP